MQSRFTGAISLMLSLGGAFAYISSPARADIPHTIAFQGALHGAGGAPVPNGTYQVVFRLYGAATGGTPLWQEPATGTKTVSVSGGQGVFATALGDAVPLAGVPFDRPLWLGVQVGADPEMTPRLPLASVPYALGIPLAGSGTALTAAHSDHDHFGQLWSGSAAAGLSAANNQTTGFPYGVEGVVNGPGAGVHGNARAATGSTYGVFGEAFSPNGTGVFGNAFYGVHGATFQANGIGVYGRGQTTDGSTIGVQGESASPQGIGVYGVNNISGNYGYMGTATTGVAGLSSNGVGVSGSGGTGVIGSGTAYGVRGDSSQYAVYGNASGTGTGVQGNGDAGVGVQGYSNSNTGVYGSSTKSHGVYGTTSAFNTSAIEGESDYGPDAYGVYGYSQSGVGVVGAGPTGVSGMNTQYSGNFGQLGTSFTGVSGHSENGAGVYGESSNFGVQGHNTVSGNYAYLCTQPYAGDFYGDVNIRGTLSKTAGSFRIDHPLDPEHKYLQHSFVESPDMMDIYNGEVTLDQHGAATVTMPDWFEALNRDFRYQLTAIGAPGPNLYIAQKVKGNRFRIAGGMPGMEVSWQVTGIRHDAYANAHRIQVEQWKTK